MQLSTIKNQIVCYLYFRKPRHWKEAYILILHGTLAERHLNNNTQNNKVYWDMPRGVKKADFYTWAMEADDIFKSADIV